MFQFKMFDSEHNTYFMCLWIFMFFLTTKTEAAVIIDIVTENPAALKPYRPLILMIPEKEPLISRRQSIWKKEPKLVYEDSRYERDYDMPIPRLKSKFPCPSIPCGSDIVAPQMVPIWLRMLFGDAFKSKMGKITSLPKLQSIPKIKII